jgi:hypothetical protein
MPRLTFEAVSSAGVSLELTNTVRFSTLRFDSAMPSGMNAEFLRSIRSLVLRDVVAGVNSMRIRSLPKLGVLSLAGYPSLTNLEIYSCGALSSLSLSALKSASQILLDGATSQLRYLGIDGTPGLDKSLSLLTIKNDSASMLDAVELSNLSSLHTVQLESLPALRSLKLTNCSIEKLDVAKAGGSSNVDITLDRVFNMTGVPVTLVWSNNSVPLQLRSFRLNSLSPIDVLNFTFLSNLESVSLRDSSRAKTIGISDCPRLVALDLGGLEGRIESLNLRRTGLASIDLTQLASNATVRLIDNRELTGVCRLPARYSGVCNITENAFYADANCAMLCAPFAIVANKVPGGAQQCPLPLVTDCQASYSISYQVVSGATICIEFDHDPVSITANSSCSARVRGLTRQTESPEIIQFSNCYVLAEQNAIVAMNFISENMSIVLSAGVSNHRFCGLDETITRPRDNNTGKITLTRALATRATLCGATCPTPPPTPATTTSTTPDMRPTTGTTVSIVRQTTTTTATPTNNPGTTISTPIVRIVVASFVVAIVVAIVVVVSLVNLALVVVVVVVVVRNKIKA